MATLREAERAIDLHEHKLSTLPNVVGIGIRPVEGPGPAEYQVAVYVSKKVSAAELRPGQAVPESLGVPDREGREGEISVPITVIESGEFAFE